VHALGAQVSTSRPLPGSTALQLGLLIILSAAILLLALGAMPRTAVPHARAAALLERHRTEIATAGGLAFVAFLIAYLL
jgi:hypothetical protein